MKTIKFILHKIIIVEVMLIILFLAQSTFQVHLPIISPIITTSLNYLTPIAIISVIIYIILCFLTSKIVEIIIGIILGGIILYYIIKYLL